MTRLSLNGSSFAGAQSSRSNERGVPLSDNKGLRSRNSAFRKIHVGQLLPDPLNWHTHGAEQRSALLSVFEEVGFVGTILVRPAKGQPKKFFIIDGHERVKAILEQYGPDQAVDCAVLNLSDEEARKILASHDSIGSMGGVDQVKLDELLGSIQFDSSELDGIIRQALEFKLDEPEVPSSGRKSSKRGEKSGSGSSKGSGSVRLELSQRRLAKFKKISDFAVEFFGTKSSGEAILQALEQWVKIADKADFQKR